VKVSVQGAMPVTMQSKAKGILQPGPLEIGGSGESTDSSHVSVPMEGGMADLMKTRREPTNTFSEECAMAILRLVAGAIANGGRGCGSAASGHPGGFLAESEREGIRCAVLAELQRMRRCYGLSDCTH
jgi:hypothetical protein